MEQTLFDNKYIITIEHLRDAILDTQIINSILTSHFFINLPVVKDVLSDQYIKGKETIQGRIFINYVNKIKCGIIKEQQLLNSPKQLQLSKSIKSVITVILIQHLIQLLEHIDIIYPYIKYTIINTDTLAIVYNLWLKSMNIDLEHIKKFNHFINPVPTVSLPSLVSLPSSSDLRPLDRRRL